VQLDEVTVELPDGELVRRALARASLDGSRRGETLTVEEFGVLSRALGEEPS
jgi:hypothetical protein